MFRLQRFKRIAVQRFRDFSLEWKVFMMTSVVIVLAVSLTGAFSIYQTSRILEGYAYNAADQTVAQLGSNINNELKSIGDKLYLINSSVELRQTIEWSQFKSDETYSVMFNKMFSLFSNVSLSSSTIRSIYLYTPRGEFYQGMPGGKRNVSFKETPYYEAIRNSPTNRWVYSKQDPLFGGDAEVLSLITRPAADTNYLDQDNYMVITLTVETFQHNLQSIQLVNGGFSLVLDEKGQPILASSQESWTRQLFQQASIAAQESERSSFDLNIDGHTYLVNHKSIPIPGWKAMVLQPKEQLMDKVSYIKYFTILLTAILLAVSFFLNKYIARMVTNPVRKLQRLMGQAKRGRLDVRFASSNRDEIGELGSHFNEMLDQIQLLLKQVVEESQAKRKAEMRVLQAQINPHFLYNTLDEIYWKALEFQDTSAADIILSLSRFFRLSLNRGEEATPISKEMEHVEQYLKLVNYQYKRQFSFEIHTDDRTRTFLVPKIILQPLAENSVLHAFKANEYKDFHIRAISRFEEPHVIVLEVEDNGCGMEPELVAHFNRPLTDDKTSGRLNGAERTGEGYAIMNIKERLWYFFGRQASFHVESELGSGSRFVIRIRMDGSGE
ncbi:MULTISPECIES: cache domain-containing sensor histidine kinase [unclassified Paenibacillus]|uniref:cache domain-containing sensor histidine kinase n=1 Tax=unclassified Paenibacillus TaxID=185978 RepID=UPI00362502B9